MSAAPPRSHGPGADRLVAPVFGALAATGAVLLALVFGFVLREAAPVLADGGVARFVADDGWSPLEGRFGLLPMVWATLAASAGALAIAAPLGIGAAIHERFCAGPRLAAAQRMTLALLAGVPSVVVGLWGLEVLVPLIARWQPPGASLLAAMLVLALMILPTVALTASSALGAVPESWLAGGAALGLGRRAVVLGIALPGARGGIVGGLVLAAARALGETMAVLMVAGNVVRTPTGLFDPVRVLTANIALEMPYAAGSHRAALFASGLALLLLVLALTWAGARLAGGSAHAH
ncbi:phosphate ABC transporter permease subunit PstC [Derxia lacustris]|uniref:phosphate ABC transporter permease subunit PstC n=1 Tax=Derxia lacustris TaxID=764842 RepID=UPI000A175CFB|nr:phosphate ABC transporter permease subunit PstC [Derxia lacustris]